MIFVGVYSHRGRYPFSGSVTTYKFKSIEAARARFPRAPLQQLRVCTKCGHEECPCCASVGEPGFGSCDRVEVSKSGDDVDVCCDGQCTFVETTPYPVLSPEAAK